MPGGGDEYKSGRKEAERSSGPLEWGQQSWRDISSSEFRFISLALGYSLFIPLLALTIGGLS